MGPVRILLEENCGATWIERVPHERIVAKPKDEEVAWREGLEHIEGSPNLIFGLLGNLTCRRVVEDGHEGARGSVKLGRDDGLGLCEGHISGT